MPIDASASDPPEVARPRGVACPACSASTDRKLQESDPLVGLGLVGCSVCGLRWLSSPPTGDALELLYTTGFYVPAAARGGRLIRALHRVNSSLRLRELDGLPVGRLLDVGSGKGHFLAAAAGAGWDALGVELAASGVRETIDRYGVPVIEGDIRDIDVPGTFDAVTLWHVLEHLPEPDTVLERVRGLLRTDGRLIISVPNMDSFQARIYGRQWFHLDLPRHIFHFTPHALRALLHRHGFTVERQATLYPEMEILGVVQSTLNAAGLESGRLYRFLKRDPTAPLNLETVVSLGLAALAMPPALVSSVVAPLLGVGASLQVRAALT